MIKVILLFLVAVLLVGSLSYVALVKKSTGINSRIQQNVQSAKVSVNQVITPSIASPLAIVSMRQKSYPGSTLSIEQTLVPGSNYNRYLASYTSDGLKIYGLLTVPNGQKPIGGWPVILFNHGYISPASYSTISSYSIMVDPLASAGYIVFKPDYRGNGNSQGSPTQPYITPDDVTDSMNALASIEKYKDVNPEKIGVFGHSMGGNVTLHELVMTHDIKAAELMAGVVGSESGLAAWWNHRFAVHSIVGNDLDTYSVFEQMIKDKGTPDTNPSYWNAIDPTQFVGSITAPIQIQVGSADEDVPTDFSSNLNDLLQKDGKAVNYHMYPGADHNLAPDLSSAMTQAVAFFNTHIK